MKKNNRIQTITKNTMREFAEWVENDRIYATWTHEDYEDVTVYEDVNADIICIRRNEKGEVIEAWME